MLDLATFEILMPDNLRATCPRCADVHGPDTVVTQDREPVYVPPPPRTWWQRLTRRYPPTPPKDMIVWHALNGDDLHRVLLDGTIEVKVVYDAEIDMPEFAGGGGWLHAHASDG